MSDAWAQFLIFHIQSALVAGLVSFVGILFFLKVFRVRDSKVRIAFLGVILMRPLVVFLDCGGYINEAPIYNIATGIRLPDILHSLPVRVISHEPADFTITDINVPMDHFIARMLIALAFVVTMLVLFRWLGLLIIKRRICRDALAADEPDSKIITALVRKLSQELGLSRFPAVIVTRGGWETPYTTGCFRHTLFAGVGLIHEMEADDLKAVLAHELAHIKRRDNLRHCLSVVLRDLQFFNPFSYMSISRINLEREVACDRIAIRTAGIAPQRLAACLVRMSRRGLSRGPLPGYGYMRFSAGNGSLLEKRVEYLISMAEPSGDKAGSRHLKRIRGVALVVLWLLLVIPQFYLYIRFGDYTFTIR